MPEPVAMRNSVVARCVTPVASVTATVNADVKKINGTTVLGDGSLVGAIEEAGAHVEYLYQRGLLGIDNLDEIENSL